MTEEEEGGAREKGGHKFRGFGVWTKEQRSRFATLAQVVKEGEDCNTERSLNLLKKVDDKVNKAKAGLGNLDPKCFSLTLCTSCRWQM